MIGGDHTEANKETANHPCFMANSDHIKLMAAQTTRMTFDNQADALLAQLCELQVGALE